MVYGLIIPIIIKESNDVIHDKMMNTFKEECFDDSIAYTSQDYESGV